MPIIRGKFQRFVGLFRDILDDLSEAIDQHEEQLKGAGDDVEPRDLIDAYLLEMKRVEQQGNNHYFSWVLCGQLNYSISDELNCSARCRTCGSRAKSPHPTH